jgi:transposase InsO family protein
VPILEIYTLKKTEPSKNEASSSIAYYIEAYYNRKRRHSAINYNIPLLHESVVRAA